MPGHVKIGRTDRDPSKRARELRTTGVPAPFNIVHTSIVEDTINTERQIHRILEQRGIRIQQDREFFEMSVADAIDIIMLVIQTNDSSIVDFSNKPKLSELVASIKLPIGKEPVSEDMANHFADRLVKIGRQGYPFAIQLAANIFEQNYPSAIKFREFWQEFIQLKHLETQNCPVPSGGRAIRNELGRDAAEYLYLLDKSKWILPSDFKYIQSFLLAGDQFIYEGYSTEIKRNGFPIELRRQAELL
jgi:hypothetical protein